MLTPKEAKDLEKLSRKASMIIAIIKHFYECDAYCGDQKLTDAYYEALARKALDFTECAEDVLNIKVGG